MKIFISYCDDGKGKDYAQRAKRVCKEENIEAWVWHDDSSSAKWLDTDIVENIDSSDAMLTIVTAGTQKSEPQKKEWSHASSFGKGNSSLREKGLPIPGELSAKNCPEFSDDSFEKLCQKLINDIVKVCHMGSDIRIQSREASDKAHQLYNIAKQLNQRQEGLDEKTMEEFNKSVWEGYLGSAMIRNIVSLSEVTQEDKDNLVHIALRSNIELDKFNAKDYMWSPAFTDVGRSVANGEKTSLIERLKREVKKTVEFCDERSDDLSALQKEIEKLIAAGQVPNVILAPPSMLKSFVHFFTDEKGKITLNRERGSAGTLEMHGMRLSIYLPGRGRLSEDLMIYNRSSVTWKVAPNPDTGYALTLGIGRGIYPDTVEFIVGTTIRCILVEEQGIIRMPIVR